MEIDSELKQVVEAILFSTPEAVSLSSLKTIIAARADGYEATDEELTGHIGELNAQYEEGGHAFRIKQVAGGYSFATRDEYHPWLEHIQHENALRKISQTALETLAIVAYKQPITKPEVDHIRGVDSGYVVKQLLEKGLIAVAGRNDGPGRALLYKTSDRFLRHFGLNAIEELPKPREIEEILQDDDMAKHRQLILELKAGMEMEEQQEQDEQQQAE
ncbi:MAG: SMC-Scp complex subunit ScpB [Balneolia bacterium]|nr:SMC-Scp complex subunit ScpB [Balneolia bacterium]